MTDQRYIDDKPDLDPKVRLAKLLQALSPAVAPGSPWPDAKPGDILASYEDASEKLFPRSQGMPLVPVAFAESAVEWAPERGARSAPIAHHDFVPLDAEWINVGGRKACVRSSNGNRIEKTVFLHMLVEGFRTTFAFSSTAYNIGQSFSRDADRVRVTIDGETVRVCGGLWLMSSELERDPQRGHTWYAPRFKLLGVLGEPAGPSLELVKQARDLRFEFKASEAKRKEGLAALSAVKPTPALTRGTMSITSGVEHPRSWADRRSEAGYAA
jgi:hypothetical protein